MKLKDLFNMSIEEFVREFVEKGLVREMEIGERSGVIMTRSNETKTVEKERYIKIVFITESIEIGEGEGIGIEVELGKEELLDEEQI